MFQKKKGSGKASRQLDSYTYLSSISYGVMYQYESVPINCLWLTAGSICSEILRTHVYKGIKRLFQCFDGSFSARVTFRALRTILI